MLVQKKTKLNCLIIVFYFVFFTQISAQTAEKIQMGFSGSLLSGKTKYNNVNGLQSKSLVTTDMSFSLIGLWSEGPCEVLYVNEDYLIFENGINMMIADYSDPANLNIISQFQIPGSCSSLIVSGDHIYAVCYTVNGTELIITDISDILNPEIVGSCVANSILRDAIYISGDYAYVLSYNEFEIFNIIDPANPVSISQFSDFGPSPGQYSVLSLAVSGDYVYASASKYGEYGITMVDISDPNDPEYFKTISSDFSKAHDIFISGDYLYAAHCDDGLVIVDISNPDSTFITAECKTEHAQKITGSGNNIIFFYRFNHDNYNVAAIDVSDPYNPVSVGGFEGSGLEMLAFGDYLFMPDGYSMTIMDVSNPAAPEISAVHSFIGSTRGVISNNDALYLVCSDGIRIFDINTPSKPLLLKTVTDNLLYVKRTGKYLYGKRRDDEHLKFYDISSPFSPQYVNTIECDFDIHRSDVFGNIAYIISNSGLFSIFDISDILNPAEAVRIDFDEHYFSRIALFGSIAFITGSKYDATVDDYIWMLKILDCSDITQPVVLNTFEIPEGFKGNKKILVNDNNLFLLDYYGVCILDISDLEKPVVSSSLKLTYATDIEIWNSHLYITSNSDNLTIYDISEITSPVLIGNSLSSYDTYDVDVVDDYIYLTCRGAGFQILKNEITTAVGIGNHSDPDAFNLGDNYPNPFNPATNIRFSVPEPSDVTLRIFNIKGQLIKTLVSGQYPHGIHLIKWDGTNELGQRVSSGVYIYRLQVGSFSQTKKMLLIK